MENLDTTEVTDGTDVGAWLVVDHEELTTPEEAVTPDEEVAEEGGETDLAEGDGTSDSAGDGAGTVGDGYDDIPAVYEQADVVEQTFDWTTLPACEYEDSDNCFWDAQASGNGYGQSFYVRDGVITYIGDNVKEPIEIIPEHENPYGVAPCYDMVIPGYEGECGVIFNTEEIGAAVTEQAETVSETQVLSHPPVLAETGGFDFLMPLLLGSVLLVGGAAMLIRKKFSPSA